MYLPSLLAPLLTLSTAVLATPLNSRQATTYPAPSPCTGSCSGIKDPSVFRRSDGTWFRFSTGNNISIASAPALTGPWTSKGPLLHNGTSIHVGDKQGIWAPDVSKIGDVYVAYYSVSVLSQRTSDIGVATSASMESGSWTDHGSVGVPKNADYNLIDPNLFTECPTCPRIWTFGSAWQGIYQTTLGEKGLKWSGSTPARQIYNSTVPPGQTWEAVVEGAFLTSKTVGGTKYYYMFWSSGASQNEPDELAAPGDEYKVEVCRSAAAAGPWMDKGGRDCRTQNGGTLVLGSHGERVYAPGGQGVTEDAGKTVLYYHYVNPKIGYAFKDFQFGFNYLDFSSGWPVLV
ncbi:endo-1,5-alpha-L-arabinosidase [Polyplosphaeria fusca]|uniref:Arabinan endo-1,5-alpha-L-arabinosidase n=1 Tax=Polyplosphaeria fusca TaxID=682080 RepID=A0A9P4QJ95_9PLEO|nr:endo-1,5-alpha-L-arabinosidase [Polyplosphaeria fusca]